MYVQRCVCSAAKWMCQHLSAIDIKQNEEESNEEQVAILYLDEGLKVC